MDNEAFFFQSNVTLVRVNSQANVATNHDCRIPHSRDNKWRREFREIFCGTNMTDHDQRFKTVIREFFVEFLQLFFKDWAEDMDLTQLEWLDKEVFPDPPEGSRHALDLVAQVPFHFQSGVTHTSILLVHIEIESRDGTERLKPRFPFYYHFLRDLYQKPVLPIALYLKVAAQGIGVDTHVERIRDLEVNRFQFLYVGLLGLDGVQYVQGENWLGVALSALMRIPKDKVAWLGAEALRRILGTNLSDQKKFLLGECVQAYLPLDDHQRKEYDKLLESDTYEGVKAMNKTVREIALEDGRREGHLDLICEMIEEYFTPLTSEIRQRLDQMSMNELKTLARRIGKASSLTELGLPEPKANP